MSADCRVLHAARLVDIPRLFGSNGADIVNIDGPLVENWTPAHMSLRKRRTWFHGSPLELETLRKGSSITQIEKLARAFSTKPSIVSVSDDGKIKHNGKSRGRVYRVTDTVTIDDIYEHPRSSIKGWEWKTKKEFKLQFLYEYEVAHYPEDILSENEIKEVKERNVPH